MRELNIDDYWITTAEDHLAQRYYADQKFGGPRNHSAFTGFTEAISMLGLCWRIEKNGEARIWDPNHEETFEDVDTD